MFPKIYLLFIDGVLYHVLLDKECAEKTVRELRKVNPLKYYLIREEIVKPTCSYCDPYCSCKDQKELYSNVKGTQGS